VNKIVKVIPWLKFAGDRQSPLFLYIGHTYVPLSWKGAVVEDTIK